MRGIFAIVRLSYLNISLHAGADHDLQSPCNRIIISLIPGPEYLCRNPAPDSLPSRPLELDEESVNFSQTQSRRALRAEPGAGHLSSQFTSDRIFAFRSMSS